MHYQSSSNKKPFGRKHIETRNILIGGKKRFYVIISALLALFLDALDTLIMGGAMPTIVSAGFFHPVKKR